MSRDDLTTIITWLGESQNMLKVSASEPFCHIQYAMMTVIFVLKVMYGGVIDTD
jgi:hypothetical protein